MPVLPWNCGENGQKNGEGRQKDEKGIWSSSLHAEKLKQKSTTLYWCFLPWASLRKEKKKPKQRGLPESRILPESIYLERRIFADRLVDLLSDLHFKLTKFRGGLQSCNTFLLTNNRVDEHTYQSCEECLLTPKKYSTKKMSQSTEQLKHLCTNACNMGKKSEEVKVMVQVESYDLITVTEIW